MLGLILILVRLEKNTDMLGDLKEWVLEWLMFRHQLVFVADLAWKS